MLPRFPMFLSYSILTLSFCTVYPSTQPEHIHVTAPSENVIIEQIVFSQPAHQPTQGIPAVEPDEPIISHNELAADSLARLAADGNINQLTEKLRNRKININQLDEKGHTSLQEAICSKHAIIVALLCKDPRIDVNAYSRQGLTALHYAISKCQCTCKQGRICDSCKIIDTLLSDKSLIVNKPKRACYRIFTYIPYYRTPHDEGITALHIAASNGDIKNTQRLIEHGADVNQPTCKGKCPLHYAARRHEQTGSFRAVIEELFKHGAHINQEDSSGFTPLHMAIINKHGHQLDNTDVVKCLLERGADINGKNCGQTPLMAAVNQNDIGMVQFLIENGAKIDLSNAYGCTALDMAVSKDFEDIQRYLLANGASCTLSKKYLETINPRPKWILYPLHEAADTGNLERIQMLLSPESPFHGSIIDTDDGACTMLHYAALKGNTAIVNYLLSKNIVIDALDGTNKTPLMHAVEKGYAEIVKSILDQEPEDYLGRAHGVNNTIGTVLLDLAIDKGHEPIVLELLQHGATKTNILAGAVVHNFQSIVDFLLKNAGTNTLLKAEGKTALGLAIEELDRSIKTKDDKLQTTIRAIIGQFIRAGVCEATDPFLAQKLTTANQEIGRFIAGMANISNIVAQHTEFDSNDKQQCDEISLECEELKGLGMHGSIRSSLQHHRSGYASHKYSGYYALFNAIEPIEENCNPDRRTRFAKFFEYALTFMQKSGTNPPYDNLTAEQLSQLLTVIKRESKQFNIVNPTTLENIVIMHLDNLADRVKGSAIQRADKAVFANFISGNIPSMRLIIRNPISSDNWFTIHAKRESNGQVSLNMYNSFSKVEKYNEALFYNICRSDIIYLYIMLTNSPDTWPCVINEELEKEIKAVCSLYTEKAKPHLEALLEDLDNFVECLSGLKDSVSNFKSRSDIRSEAPVQRIIDTLRLSALSREYTILFNNIITDFRGLNLKNPVVQEFQKFITTYALSVKDLKEKFSFLIDNKSAEEERKILTAGEMIGTLRHITDDAIALKAKIAQQPDSLTKGKFFDAAPESISYDKLEIIKKYLQPNLKAFIREQLSGATSRAKTLLFYGEPGNGKTTIAQAIAQLCPYKDETGKLKERPFRIIRAPALGTKYKHSKTEQLNSITTFIRENPYAVVLLDEIDALADSKHDQDPVVQDFQQVMDNATNVIFIGTTNSEIQATVTIDMPDQKTKPIAPALLSRFQNRIKIENPTLDHRRAIIKNCLTMLAAKDPNISITLSKQEEESLARRTAGFSIRDLETVFILAHQYVFAPHSPSDDDMSIVQYRQLTNEHIEAGVQAIEKGKRINYMHIAGIILKNVALYGSPWLSLAHALYSSYIHGLQRNEDILRLELHRGQDRVQHFSEVRDDIMRNYAIRNEGQAIHEAERAQDLYTQELQRDENWRWQVAHTAISLAGLGVQGYSALKSAK